MDPPSNLPSFARLARDLALAARVPFEDDVAIDLFLGSMPVDFDVHAHAHRLITPPASAPNPTHQAIMRVAGSSGPTRVVTTNFDDHLSSAAVPTAVDGRWIGPALPMGDSFTGVVHLHGSVMRPPAELVLTDRDFGRAYLYDAWATRFLQKMFDKFTVLFVGYSLDDPIMRYLSLGLPSKTRRYVLTHKPDEEKWEHLGIVPITYPGTDDDHSALLAALQSWDLRARMGQLEHRARMREIIDGGTALTPVERDYLLERLRVPDGARDFANAATTVAWLEWAETLPEFRALFNGGDTTGELFRILADWFGRYILDPVLHGAALQTVQRLGQKFGPVLFEAASWSAEHLSRADWAAGQRWKTLLATSIDGHSTPPALGLLLPHAPNSRVEPPSLIRAAVRPFLVLKRSWLRGDGIGDTPPTADVAWHEDEHSLNAHLQRVIADAPAGEQALGALLEDALNDAYDLLSGYHGERDFDPLGFGRSAIEPHEQDRHRNAEDAVIDALRDFGMKALPIVPELSDRWWNQERPLFRRLALHLLSKDESRSGDEKLRWVLDRGILYRHHEKHETFGVLALTLADASPEVRAEVLAAALLGPEFPADVPEREKHVAYSTYNLIAWLAQSAPDWDEAAAVFAGLQLKNPTFGVRENPDLDRWSSSGSWGGRLPVDPEDFKRDAETDLASAFADLVDRDYSERNFDEPTWDDALSVIRRVTEIDPPLGLDLWDLIDDQSDLGDRATQLKQAIIRGWARADLGEEAESALALVSSQTCVADSARPISEFLVSQIRKRVDDGESPIVAALRNTADELWIAQHSAFEHGPDSQPDSLALNSWPGELAEYWMVEVDRRWRHNRDSWEGFDAEEAGAIQSLLNGPAATLDATRPAFASSLYFLFAADPTFVETYILPLFGSDESAHQVWTSFLYNARVNDQMLGAGLLDALVSQWGRLESLSPHGLLDQFLDLSASVVSFAGLTPSARQLILDQSVLAANGKYSPDFAAAVARLLDAPDVDGAELWTRWLNRHLADRLMGLPRTARPEELARWADSVPFLGDSLPEAVELFRGSTVGLGADYNAPEFPAGSISSHPAELVEHLAHRVRNTTREGWRLPHAVVELIGAVRDVVGDEVNPLVEAAIDQGFITAS